MDQDTGRQPYGPEGTGREGGRERYKNYYSVY